MAKSKVAGSQWHKAGRCRARKVMRPELWGPESKVGWMRWTGNEWIASEWLYCT